MKIFFNFSPDWTETVWGFPMVRPESLNLTSNQAGEEPAGKTDENRAEKGSPESIYVEASDQARYHPEEESVDHQKEETQGENCERDRQQDKNGADNGVYDPQENRSAQGSPYRIHPYQTGEKIGNAHDGRHVDQQSDEKLSHHSPPWG